MYYDDEHISSYYDTIRVIKNSNARFELVKEARSSLKPGSSKVELVDESCKHDLKRDKLSSKSIDHLDLDKIESMLDMISKMNDILRDDPNFDRANKCKLALKSFECYKQEIIERKTRSKKQKSVRDFFKKL